MLWSSVSSTIFAISEIVPQMSEITPPMSEKSVTSANEWDSVCSAMSEMEMNES